MTEAAITRPYLNTQDVIAAPDQATADRLSEDLEGAEIMVEEGTPEAAKLEMDTDAKVIPVPDIAVILGRMKPKLAAELHDKVLLADAEMNRADWMTAGAALVGVGIGFGLWWMDAAAAIVIGLDVTRDGSKYARAAMKDLLDGRPRRHDESTVHPLVGRVRATVAALDWVEVAAVRTREPGHVISVSVLAVPRDETALLDRVEDAVHRICELDWKLQDVVVSVVRELEDAPDEVLVRPSGARAAH